MNLRGVCFMKPVTSSSPVSSPQPSHHDELFMQQKMVFSESLNELKNLRKQLHSAAEYFELSYSKDEQKQIVVETLKDYTIKAFINTVDHLGSVADKVNASVDQQFGQLSGSDLKFSCIQQRMQTCQDFIDRSSSFQQSLAVSFPKHHKRYIVPAGETAIPVDQSNLVYHSVEEDWFQFNNGISREISPTIVSEDSSVSTQSPKSSSPKTFQFTRIVTKAERERQDQTPRELPVILRSGSLTKRSTTINSSSSKQRYPREPWRSVSMSLPSDRERKKSPEKHSGLNKRLLKALVSMRKSRKDAKLHKYFEEN